MTEITLSLVIPCYNEVAGLPLLIDRLAETFVREDVEVVLVDNGSTDDSPSIFEKETTRLSFLRSVRVAVNQGYGHGIVAGLSAAKGHYIGWTHADMQTDPQDAIRALTLIEEARRPDTIYVKGKRFGRPLGDVTFTIGMSTFETVLFWLPLWDINGQPNIFPRAFFETWQDPPKDFSLDLFAYVMAIKQRLAVRRFPVEFGERAHGASHWNVDWSSKAKFIKRTLDFSFRLNRELRSHR